MSLHKKIKKYLLDFLFPITCVGCEKETTHVCDACTKNISFLPCFNLEAQGLNGLIAATEHNEKSVIIKLIHRFKYEGAQEIGEILVKLSAPHIAPYVSELKNAQLIPVPLHVRRFNGRGFNQSELLAQEFGKKFSMPVEKILIRHRYTPAQVELGRNERLKNVQNAFSLRIKRQKLDEEKTYVLVDDVTTTGATLGECAKVLKENGAGKIFGLVIARAL